MRTVITITGLPFATRDTGNPNHANNGQFASGGGGGSSSGGKEKSPDHHRMEKALHEELSKREGHGLSKEKVEAIAADFVGKKSVDVMKLSDKHGISIGMAKALNQARKDHVGSSAVSATLSQAGRAARYLKENR